MRFRRLLITASAVAVAAPAAAVADETGSAGPILVTARKREEALSQVPVAATAVTGETLIAQGIHSVREAAALSPGLTITSDGTGRAFVAIRGIGVTLVQTVQPGVGLFIDGIYQPNTAYLNNPLLDVARIEVLRGPQGTLYGKNTLGGAINVITRQPGDALELRANASYAGPDAAWLVSGSVSTPVVADLLAVRLAASHRQQEGFQTNTVIGGKQNALNTDSLNATIRLTPAEDLSVTVKGYHDWIAGTNTPYARVTGPRDYARSVPFNARNLVRYRYRGLSAKLEVPIEGLASRLSLVGSYDARSGRVPDNDTDFGPANLVRSTSSDELRTRTAELRLDSQWSDRLSSLFGLFTSRETSSLHDVTRIVPAARARTTLSSTQADTHAAFGTLFWKPDARWELALGLRYDHENRLARGVVTFTGAGLAPGGPLPDARIRSDQVEPRLTLKRQWSPALMTYGSIARGYRGGGFNAPSAPLRTYQGDSAWTYEVGAKLASARVNLAAAVFYNDYKDYIGLNSIAPAAGGGVVTVDLNTGDVESYGVEFEGALRPVPAWTLRGALTLMHGRITDDSSYRRLTGRVLASDRLTFQPDWTATLGTDYTLDVGRSQLVLAADAVGKGKRLAATLSQTATTFLDRYWLVGGSITWRTGPFEISGFVRNLFDKDYFESYIEKTTLQLAGLPASDLGLAGDRRRYGLRLGVRY